MTTPHHELKIRGALLCTTSDFPATRKLCGFAGHSASSGCSKCLKQFQSRGIILALSGRIGQLEIWNHIEEQQEKKRKKPRLNRIHGTKTLGGQRWQGDGLWHQTRLAGRQGGSAENKGIKLFKVAEKTEKFLTTDSLLLGCPKRHETPMACQLRCSKHLNHHLPKPWQSHWEQAACCG